LIANETITVDHPLVSSVTGDTIFISGENISVTGNVEVQSGYFLVLQALSQISISPDANLNKNIQLRIKRDFYDTPIFEYTDNSEVYNFCNNSNQYHANVASKSLHQQIRNNVELKPQSLKKETNLEKSFVSIHPNPANSQIRITSSSKPISEVKIFDLSGRSLIHKKIGEVDTQQVEVDVNSLQSGVYIVQTICGDERSSEKLVIGK